MDSLKRIEKWDILKLLLIFLVVFGHLLDYFIKSNWLMKGLFFGIYSFHMPLFIFVSGMFCKNTVNKKRYKKIFNYFLLFYLYKLLLYIIKLIVLKNNVTFSFFNEGAIPWYMLAMGVFCLITIVTKKLDKKLVLCISVIIACVAGYINFPCDFLAISRIIVFYPFFFAGYIIEPDVLAQKLNKKSLKIISGILIALFAVFVIFNIRRLYWLRPLLSGRQPFSKLKVYSRFGALLRLGYYAFTAVLGTAVICLIPMKLGSGKIARLGSRSIQVYFMQYFFIYPFMDYVWHHGLRIPTTVAIVLLSAAITFICSLKIWEPIFRFLTNPFPSKKSVKKKGA